jgi:transcriptional regulator with XRE-family HTH domain
MDFAQRIRELRKKKGMTQTELAKSLGKTLGTISTWETGKRKPEFETMDALCDYFDVNLGYLIGSSDDPTLYKPTQEELNELGLSEVEDELSEHAANYCRLDDWGRLAVQAVINAEYKRCQAEKTLNMNKLSVRVHFEK